MTSRINYRHVSRTDRARYNEAQGIEILRGNSRDAHAETADNRSGSIAGNVAAKPSEPAHGRLRLWRAPGCTSCSWAPPLAPSPGTANRCPEERIWGRRSCYAPPCSRARSSIGASRRLSIAAPSGSSDRPSPPSARLHSPTRRCQMLRRSSYARWARS